jgi:uncharacterized protein YidB (DUF937 family)
VPAGIPRNKEAIMGILEDLLAGAVSGGGMGNRPQPRSGGSGSLGGSGALAALLPIVIAMLANRQRGAGGGPGGGGGLGDLLGQALGTGRGAGAGGGLGDILGQVLGGGAAGGGGGPGGAGGLGGLLEQLGRGGLTQHAQSWVGPGQNMSVSAGQIRDVFGQRGLAAIAQQSGLSEDEASEGLAQLLPEIVNHVTPQGQVPQGDQLDSALEGLLRRFAR